MYTILGGVPVTLAEFNIAGQLPVSAEKVEANAKHVKELGLKTYRSWRTDKTRLAVVGGGPSINTQVETLQNWDGDIWAINGAWKWCKDRGIKATFFACDPHPIVTQWCEGVETAILEQSCDPEAFKSVADVYTFDAGPEGITSYASTASCAPHLAIRMNYRSVTFFGCESSYQFEASHAYMNEKREEQIIVRCDGGDYLTAPDLFIQVVGLSNYIREVPEFLSESSGGLLRAMVNDPNFHIVWISQSLFEAMQQKTPVGLISPAYQDKKLVSGAMQMADNPEAFGLDDWTHSLNAGRAA